MYKYIYIYVNIFIYIYTYIYTSSRQHLLAALAKIKYSHLSTLIEVKLKTTKWSSNVPRRIQRMFQKFLDRYLKNVLWHLRIFLLYGDDHLWWWKNDENFLRKHFQSWFSWLLSEFCSEFDSESWYLIFFWYLHICI
jgi:hypothetical protein